MGSQAGVVDINHAFHLYYKTLYVGDVGWVIVDRNLTSRVFSLLKIDPHLHLNELSLICDMWLNKIALITYLITFCPLRVYVL